MPLAKCLRSLRLSRRLSDSWDRVVGGRAARAECSHQRMNQESVMTQTHNLQRMLLLALASTTIISAPIHAQSAIFWRTEDGGNGHYYAVNSSALTWSAAQLHAANLGAHLVSITSAEENTFVYTLVEPIPYGSASLILSIAPEN